MIRVQAVVKYDMLADIVRNVRLGLVNFFGNLLDGGGAVVYNGIFSASLGRPLPPLAVSRSSFVRNEALGPGGAIIAYNIPEPFEFEGRVRFRRNVSVQNATLNDFADVDIDFP